MLLTKYLQSGKYLKRIIGQLRKLISNWQGNNFIDLGELYAELYPPKESLGEHAGCGGEVIVSGSYFRCRKCKNNRSGNQRRP